LDLPTHAMSARPLPRSRPDNPIPPLGDGQALVALVPATGDLRWAAAAAWDVARAAALHGRRVALVDLWIEDPTLHEVAGLTPTEGIVDAFEYGVSLTKTAHEVDHVFFIAAGAYTAHPGELFGHERWKKLHGGFRVEGALLLPDPARRAANRRTRPVLVAATLVAGAAGVWALFTTGGESIRASGAEHRAASPTPVPPRVRPTAAPAPRLDSLPWAVQLAA